MTCTGRSRGHHQCVTCCHVLDDADAKMLVHHGVQAAHGTAQQQLHLYMIECCSQQRMTSSLLFTETMHQCRDWLAQLEQIGSLVLQVSVCGSWSISDAHIARAESD